MKKNITINLFGALYNIDEDAYELLEQYQTNMRRYFMRQEGGEEIADDIEHRVAELIAELKANGVEAITIEHVQDIIHRIGNPEEMETAENETDKAEGSDETEGTATPPPAPDADGNEPRPRRKLFRDPEDKMVGGVLSGLCQYFGFTDPLPWRIIFVLLCIFTYSGFAFVYLLAWALMPEARTPEERLLMCGKPVNPQTLNEELMRGMNATRNFINDPANQSKARGCLSTLLNIVVVCFKIFAIFILLILAFCALMFVFFIVVMAVAGSSAVADWGMADSDFMALIGIAPSLKYWYAACCVLGLAVVALPLYALIHNLVRRKDGKESSAFATWMGVLAWVIVAAFFCCSLGFSIQISKEAEDRIDRNENTRDGIYLSKVSWRTLQENGWNISNAKNLRSSLSGSEQDPRGEDGEKWMDCIELESDKDDKGAPEFRLEKSVAVEPGTYRIEALYHMDDGKSSGWFVQVPGTATGHKGTFSTLTPHSRFSDYSWAEAAQRPVLSGETDSICWPRMLHEASDGGWHYFAQDVTVTQAGTLKFGFYQDAAFNLSGSATKELKLADVRFTRLGSVAGAQ